MKRWKCQKRKKVTENVKTKKYFLNVNVNILQVWNEFPENHFWKLTRMWEMSWVSLILSETWFLFNFFHSLICHKKWCPHKNCEFECVGDEKVMPFIGQKISKWCWWQHQICHTIIVKSFILEGWIVMGMPHKNLV